MFSIHPSFLSFLFVILLRHFVFRPAHCVFPSNDQHAVFTFSPLGFYSYWHFDPGTFRPCHILKRKTTIQHMDFTRATFSRKFRTLQLLGARSGTLRSDWSGVGGGLNIKAEESFAPSIRRYFTVEYLRDWGDIRIIVRELRSRNVHWRTVTC